MCPPRCTLCTFMFITYCASVKRSFSRALLIGTRLVAGKPTFLAGFRAAVRPPPAAQAVPGGRLPAAGRIDAVPGGRVVQPGERHAGFRQLRRHTRRHVLRGWRVGGRILRPVSVRRQRPRRPTPPVCSETAVKRQ